MQIGALMSEIFIVDDDPSVRSALAVVLTGEGHQVTSFIEGEAFLSVRARAPRDASSSTYTCRAAPASTS
jgi:FixJ family two-component response regulator